MKNNNYSLIINKGKSFFLEGSISFKVYSLWKEIDRLKKDKANS